MDEFIYLSESKLRQFIRARPNRFQVKEVSGQLGPPFIQGRVSISGASNRLSAIAHQLGQVKQAMELSQRAPLWFEDGRAEPGDWIQFEFRAEYAVIKAGANLLFVLTQSTEAQSRMLLYGSPRNLLRRMPNVTEPSVELDSTIDSIRILLEELLADHGLPNTSSPRWHVEAIAQILTLLDQPLTERAYVEGWARLMGHINTEPADSLSHTHHGGVSIASPLYVRYFNRPGCG